MDEEVVEQESKVEAATPSAGEEGASVVQLGFDASSSKEEVAHLFLRYDWTIFSKMDLIVLLFAFVIVCCTSISIYFLEPAIDMRQRNKYRQRPSRRETQHD